MRAPTEQVISISRLICTGCGAETNATCNCGMDYKPKSVRAREAVEANPEKSNRAIAAETGVDEKEVRRQRAKLEESTADMSAVEERVGLDGKTRKMPDKKVGPAEKARGPAFDDRLCEALDEAEKAAKDLKKHELTGDAAALSLFCLRNHLMAIDRVANAIEKKYREELGLFREKVAAEKEETGPLAFPMNERIVAI
jgi:hypothetical protein